MSQVESNSAWSTPHHHGTRHGTRQRIQLIDTIQLQRIRLELQHLRPLILEFAKRPCFGEYHVSLEFTKISRKKKNTHISQYHRVTKTGSLPRCLVSGVTLLPWLLIRAGV